MKYTKLFINKDKNNRIKKTKIRLFLFLVNFLNIFIINFDFLDFSCDDELIIKKNRCKTSKFNFF